jgi:hypothetical protein
MIFKIAVAYVGDNDFIYLAKDYFTMIDAANAANEYINSYDGLVPLEQVCIMRVTSDCVLIVQH